MRIRPWRLAALGALALSASAQPQLHLKTRDRGSSSVERRSPLRPQESLRLNPSRLHWLVQFETAPGVDDIAALKDRGARIVSYVPDWAFIVAADDTLDLDGLNVYRKEHFAGFDKVSPQLDSFERGEVLVRFHGDVDLADSLEVLRRSGVSRIDSPSLGEKHFLVSGSERQIAALAGWDEVEYIFPADPELAKGTPFHFCSGANTISGPVAQLSANVGQWSPGKSGPVALNVAYGDLGSKVDHATVRGEIAKALDTWSNQVQVSFTEVETMGGLRTLAFRFGRGPNGGPEGFDGPGGTIAYAYFPSPPNPEPIAGDLYFDDDENWRVGFDIDIFSVALHEIGHSLGLGHSDTPGAVMYPYYRRATALAADDISSIQAIYLSRTQASPPTTADPSPVPPAPAPPAPVPPPAPSGPSDTIAPSVAVTWPVTTIVSMPQPSIAMRGTASDNVGVTQVTYSTSTGYSGVAGGTSNWSASIPLIRGYNMVTIRAYDAAGNSSWRSVTVIRR